MPNPWREEWLHGPDADPDPVVAEAVALVTEYQLGMFTELEQAAFEQRLRSDTQFAAIVCALVIIPCANSAYGAIVRSTLPPASVTFNHAPLSVVMDELRQRYHLPRWLWLRASRGHLLRHQLEERMQQCRLALHPTKTKIVYCKDADRTAHYPNISLMKRTVRAWRLKWCSEKSIEDLSRMFNPIARGWIQYYSKYYKSALFPYDGLEI